MATASPTASQIEIWIRPRAAKPNSLPTSSSKAEMEERRISTMRLRFSLITPYIST
jgi:hypothetical protein